MQDDIRNEIHEPRDLWIILHDEPVDFSSLGREQFSQIGPILPTNPGDQGSSLTHRLWSFFCSSRSDSTII